MSLDIWWSLGSIAGCFVSSWSGGFYKRPPTHKIPSIRAGSSLITWLDFLTFFVSIRDDHWSGKLPICTTSMISLSADFNSSTFRGLVFFSLWGGECLPCFRLRTEFLQAILDLSIQPTSFLCLCQLENRSNMDSIGVAVAVQGRLTKEALFISKSPSFPWYSFMATGRWGQVHSSCKRKLRPLIRLVDWTMSSMEIPLDPSAAGLSFVSTYLHSEGRDCSRIPDTRLATKVSNVFWSFST